MTAKTIDMHPETLTPNADSPATISLPSTLVRPAVLESSVFIRKIRSDRDTASAEISKLDAELASIEDRKTDLMFIVTSCDGILNGVPKNE